MGQLANACYRYRIAAPLRRYGNWERVAASAKLGALVMPHTPELIERLREALAIADTAKDDLAGAYIATPIAILEAREADRLSNNDPTI